MKNMGGGAGGELPDSDDEEDDEEEAAGEPMKPKNDGLGDLEGEVEKNPAAEAKPAEAAKKEEDDELD